MPDPSSYHVNYRQGTRFGYIFRFFLGGRYGSRTLVLQDFSGGFIIGLRRGPYARVFNFRALIGLGRDGFSGIYNYTLGERVSYGSFAGYAGRVLTQNRFKGVSSSTRRHFGVTIDIHLFSGVFRVTIGATMVNGVTFGMILYLFV